MRKFAFISVAFALVAVSFYGCDEMPNEPLQALSSNQEASVEALLKTSQGKITVCHRTNGVRPFLPLSVSAAALDAHVAHGDGLVGEPVPDQPGYSFNEECDLVLTRRTITVTGRWNGTSYLFSGLFTVDYAGPVDAVVTVEGYDGQMFLALLGYRAGEPSSCSTLWLPEPIPRGPTMATPIITAGWSEVPPATYCLNVLADRGGGPYPPPYSWTATITYP